MTTTTPLFQQTRQLEQMLARCIGRINRFKSLGQPSAETMQRLVAERDSLKRQHEELTKKMTASL